MNDYRVVMKVGEEQVVKNVSYWNIDSNLRTVAFLDDDDEIVAFFNLDTLIYFVIE